MLSDPLSGLLNRILSWVLNVPAKDFSSGFRLFRKSILDDLPAGSAGVDPSMAALRWVRRNGRDVAAGRYSTVFCSQVIGHIPDSDDYMIRNRCADLVARLEQAYAGGGELILRCRRRD